MFTLLEANGAQGSGWSMIIMIVAMLAIVYFFMIRPQRNQQKKIDEFRNNLKIGDKVITASGVHGTIKSINDGMSYFTIEIAKGVSIEVERNFVYESGQNLQQQ